LLHAARQRDFYGEGGSGLVQLSVLDALLSAVAQKDYAAAERNLGRTTAASGRRRQKVRDFQRVCG
jgi:DNA-binding MurR/RpiR family transcriptional regulator